MDLMKNTHDFPRKIREITDNMEVKHKSLKIWILYRGSFALLKRKTSCPILYFIFDRLNSINYPNAVIHWLHWFFNVSWYTTLLYTVLALICGILYIYIAVGRHKHKIASSVSSKKKVEGTKSPKYEHDG